MEYCEVPKQIANGTPYYFVTSTGEVSHSTYAGNKADIKRVMIGNWFPFDGTGRVRAEVSAAKIRVFFTAQHYFRKEEA